MTRFFGAAKYEAVDALLIAQDGRCAYRPTKLMRHGRKKATLDHVMPLGVGGADEFRNLLAVCYPCNQEKGCSLPVLEFHEAIRRRVHSEIERRGIYCEAA